MSVRIDQALHKVIASAGFGFGPCHVRSVDALRHGQGSDERKPVASVQRTPGTTEPWKARVFERARVSAQQVGLCQVDHFVAATAEYRLHDVQAKALHLRRFNGRRHGQFLAIGDDVE